MNFLTCICHIPLLAIYSHCNHLEYHRKLLCANFNLCHLGTCPTKFGSNKSSQFQEKNFKESAKYSTLGDYAADKDPMNKFGGKKQVKRLYIYILYTKSIDKPVSVIFHYLLFESSHPGCPRKLTRANCQLFCIGFTCFI